MKIQPVRPNIIMLGQDEAVRRTKHRCPNRNNSPRCGDLPKPEGDPSQGSGALIRQFQQLSEKLTQLSEKLSEMLSQLLERLAGQTAATPTETDPNGIQDAPGTTAPEVDSTPESTTPTLDEPEAPTDAPETSTDPEVTTESNDAPISFEMRPRAFSHMLERILVPNKNGKIDEEQLQFGIAAYLIKQKSPEISKTFQKTVKELVAKGQAQGKKANLYEDAVKSALRRLVKSGDLTRQEARNINGLSFSAAQLDDNTNKLFNGHKNKQGKTKAVALLERAISKAQQSLGALLAENPSEVVRKLNTP